MLPLPFKNPFQYLTPDQIEAQEALNLFVDVFKDYYQILNPGNTFIQGPRGSGKSMMFRIMKPDCQRLRYKKKLSEIDFYSILIPIKDTNLDITELQILKDKHGGNLLNEHYLVLYFSIVIFHALSKEEYNTSDIEEVRKFYELTKKLLIRCGYSEDFLSVEINTPNKYFTILKEVCENIQSDFITKYVSKLICGNENLGYLGPLCLYQNFLFPVLKEINQFSFLPKSPIYLLIDDADELNLLQTKILNSWVSFRSNSVVCFKISTQLKYLTYFTTKGGKIDSPHDYFEITLNQVYTSEQKERYHSNVKEIVEKRLITILDKRKEAGEFFPENLEQKKDLQELFNKLRDEKSKEVGADKAYDYAYRNYRPDYMLSLPNQYTYSYAGFDQLVHLSSGIIRNFLDLAAKMYTSESNKKGESEIDFISVPIQDKEIFSYSTNLLSNEFDKLIDDKGVSEEGLNKHKKLRNLIDALGKSFRVILESKSSERRKFSFYFDHQLRDETKDVLQLGVIYGYFHTATLGSKTGLGRSKLYILNRMLAPYYRLDPLSFSGYLYLTSSMIELAMNNPNLFVRKIKMREYDYDKKIDLQLELFSEDEYYPLNESDTIK